MIIHTTGTYTVPPLKLLPIILLPLLKPLSRLMKCGAARPKLILLSAGYRKHLSDGWVAVLGFLSLFDVSVQSLGRSGPLWDQALRRYAKWAYETRSRPLGLLVHGLLAVQKRARINRFDLKRAWEFTWAWRTATPSQARTPLPK